MNKFSKMKVNWQTYSHYCHKGFFHSKKSKLKQDKQNIFTCWVGIYISAKSMKIEMNQNPQTVKNDYKYLRCTKIANPTNHFVKG